MRVFLFVLVLFVVACSSLFWSACDSTDSSVGMRPALTSHGGNSGVVVRAVASEACPSNTVDCGEFQVWADLSPAGCQVKANALVPLDSLCEVWRFIVADAGGGWATFPMGNVVDTLGSWVQIQSAAFVPPFEEYYLGFRYTSVGEVHWESYAPDNCAPDYYIYEREECNGREPPPPQIHEMGNR